VDNTWFLAALWVGLALVATLFAIWFRVSTALSEIVVGTVAQLIIGVAIGGEGLGAQTPWVGFLAGNDLGTVIALGLIFAPFTIRTLVFVGVSVVAFGALPFITPRFFRRYGGRVAELEAKFILLALFGMGGLALWAAGSEPVLPAYIIGMVLAGTVGKDHVLIRRLRTLTFGLLTPFYFIRAGSFVSVPALVAAPSVFVILFLAKMVTKMAGCFRRSGSSDTEMELTCTTR
jgi:glutathione-regulated potassium-efflux system ancillary protein KefC